MTLVIVLIVTISISYLWYKRNFSVDYNEHLLVSMLLIASIVIILDSFLELISKGINVFKPSLQVFLEDTLFGFIIIILAFLIWLISIFIEDPKKIIK